jgi:hypothetical protein
MSSRIIIPARPNRQLFFRVSLARQSHNQSRRAPESAGVPPATTFAKNNEAYARKKRSVPILSIRVFSISIAVPASPAGETLALPGGQ